MSGALERHYVVYVETPGGAPVDEHRVAVNRRIAQVENGGDTLRGSTTQRFMVDRQRGREAWITELRFLIAGNSLKYSHVNPVGEVQE